MKETVQKLIDDGRYDEAFDILNSRIGEQPDDDEAYYLRGSVYQHIGKWGEAMSDFNKAIAINPDSPAVTLRQLLQDIIDYRYTDLLNP